MIPHKLQLKNFLSYGSQLQTIDFSPYSLICLSGKNGHGKSALLDAMTWALWGLARKVVGPVKADQGLIRLGQVQMLVIFDFEFSGIVYRIRREYVHCNPKPIVSLEFGMIDTNTNAFIALTDKTIRMTQAKIDHTLRLDFESFVNSAFLRQGGSNEFSKKSAKERKQILATILGLDHYEVIKRVALEKVKEAHNKKVIMQTLQEKRMVELQAQEPLLQSLLQHTTMWNDLKDQEKNLQHQQQQLAQEQAMYSEEKKQHELLLLQMHHIKQQETTLQCQVRTALGQWRTINRKRRLLVHKDIIEQEKSTLLVSIAQYQHLFQKSLECKEQLLHIVQQLHELEQHEKDIHAQQMQSLLLEIERLTTQQNNSMTMINTSHEQLAKYEAEYNAHTKTIQQLHNDLPSTITTEQKCAENEQQLEKRKAAYHQFVSMGNWMSSELNTVVHKKKLTNDDNNPSCPLCEQTVSASRRRLLRVNFEKQEQTLHHRLNRLKYIIPALKELLVKQHAQIITDKEQIQKYELITLKIKEYQAMQEKIKLYTQEAQHAIAFQTQEIAQRTTAIDTLRKQAAVQSSTNNLANDPVYQNLVCKKQVTEHAIKEYAYDTQRYNHAQKRVVEIEQQMHEYQEIAQELLGQTYKKDEIIAICSQLKVLKKQKATCDQDLIHYKDLEKKYIELQEKNRTLGTLQKQLTTQKEVLLQEKSSLETEQKQIEKIKDEYKAEQKNVALCDAVIEDYQIIATATGKDGIQALLIEDAIPEIEQEANQLLSQLTNNQSHILIESLRDLKGGGTKETLDIKISDSAGIRPYEMFSGGEAFRIDFALRIAISKLLARRAGTALQTLIIDEGFGSQDEEGLNNIMDALHAIQDNFSKIIIVSHLSAMKDQFPVHFVVEKGVQGSVVRIVEQG